VGAGGEKDNFLEEGVNMGRTKEDVLREKKCHV
jgi:hypothetical protein